VYNIRILYIKKNKKNNCHAKYTQHYLKHPIGMLADYQVDVGETGGNCNIFYIVLINSQNSFR